MTPKERLLNAITGRETDRLPWAPILAYWWEAQPLEFQRQGGLEFLESIGADPLFRGFYAPWKLNMSQTGYREIRKESEIIELFETPVGTLRLVRTYSPAGNTWFVSKHPVETAEDLKTLQWIYEHVQVEEDPMLEEELRKLGDRALALPLVGCEQKTCFQSMVEKWVGTENLAYLVADEPELIKETLAVMQRPSMETARICAEKSSAEAFIFFEDTSTTNINPTMFHDYIMPEIEQWADILHASGKLLIHHACGHLRALLSLMAQTHVDAIESISPPPTGNVEMDTAFSILPERIALIGGIEAVFFKDCTVPELEERVRYLEQLSQGRRYVLSNSDSCPPGVSLEKFRAVAPLLRHD